MAKGSVKKTTTATKGTKKTAAKKAVAGVKTKGRGKAAGTSTANA